MHILHAGPGVNKAKAYEEQERAPLPKPSDTDESEDRKIDSINAIIGQHNDQDPLVPRRDSQGYYYSWFQELVLDNFKFMTIILFVVEFVNV